MCMCLVQIPLVLLLILKGQVLFVPSCTSWVEKMHRLSGLCPYQMRSRHHRKLKKLLSFPKWMYMNQTLTDVLQGDEK